MAYRVVSEYTTALLVGPEVAETLSDWYQLNSSLYLTGRMDHEAFDIVDTMNYEVEI